LSDKKNVSFFHKTPTVCPVCEADFSREELLSGGGRLIAGDLTPELRRNYEPSARYGEVWPIIYPVTVCPNCFFAALPGDFDDALDADIAALQAATEERQHAAGLLFDDLDYFQPRGLHEGMASYLLATMSYDYRGEVVSPTFKRGLCSLRAAWLANDLERHEPDSNWTYVAELFYRKARFFYALAMEREESAEESLQGVHNYGPDSDQNYSFEGLIYIAALLEFRFGPRNDGDKRAKALDRAKISLSKVFGFGRASREKPTPILEHARETFAAIDEEIDQLRAS
jgi:uncharacterized protein (DUF2225 family)